MNVRLFVLSLLVLTVFCVPSLRAQWIQTSGPFTCPMVYGIAAIPNGTHATKLFAATESGVWRSTDNGVSWTASTSGLKSFSVHSIAVAPNGAGGINIFAGTRWRGLHISTDDGVTWGAISLENGEDIPSLTVVSNESKTSTTIYAGGNYGISRSTDYGATWRSANNGFSRLTNIYALAPGNDKDGSTIFAGLHGEVYRSIDRGAAWGECSNGIKYQAIVSSLLAVDSNLYVGMRDVSTEIRGGIWVSPDNGATWNATALQQANVHALAAHSNDHGGMNLYAATSSSGIMLSTDNGARWTSLTNGLWGAQMTVLTAVARVPGSSILYTGGSTGIFVSTNTGANWTATAYGWATADAQCLAFNPFGAGNGQLFAATGLGVYQSTDHGARWTTGSTKEPVTSFAFSSDDAGATRIFASMSKGIVLSTDSGKTWKQSTMHQMPTNAVLVSGHDPVGKTVIAGGRDGVYRSSDNGASWFTTDKAPQGVTALAESVSDSLLYAGTDGSGMFVSAGVVKPWLAVSNGLGNLHVRCLAVSRIAGEGEFLFAGTDSGLYRSSNDGNQWTSTALANTRIRALVVLRDARGGSNLFAGIEGGDGGILLSTDHGDTWSSVGAGLGNASIHSLALTPEWMTPRRLFAGTASLRVWRRDVSEMVSPGIDTSVVHPSPSDLSFFVYPNPARDRLQVRYDPRHIPGEIEMFTVLGVRVERAMTSEAGAAEFDVNTLPTGLYVLRLRSAVGSVFRRVTILR